MPSFNTIFFVLYLQYIRFAADSDKVYYVGDENKAKIIELLLSPDRNIIFVSEMRMIRFYKPLPVYQFSFGTLYLGISG
jgi:hypothetical protein